MLRRLRGFLQGELTTADLTRRLAALHGDRIAVHLDTPLEYAILRERHLTYTDLDRLVRKLSAVLASGGVTAGERVVLAQANRFELLLLALAAMRLGAVAVPLHEGSRAEEIRWALESSGAGTLVVDRACWERAFSGAQTSVPRRLFATGKASDLPPQGTSIDAALDVPLPVPPPANVRPEDVAMILYTSGTTGRPKGALLTSGGLLGRLRPAMLWKAPRGASAVVPLPLAHIMGLVSTLLPLVAGVRVHFFGEFDAVRVLRAIEERRATFFVGVPTMYRMMVEAGLDRFDLSSIRAWISAADRMPADLMAEFKRCGTLFEVGPVRAESIFIDAYGSVELAGAAIVRISPPGTSRLDRSFFGMLLPPYHARIVRDDGTEAGAGEVGELWIQGPGVMRGYVPGSVPRSDEDEEASRAVLGDGWVRTGDLASRDRIGLIHFVDRRKDVIKSGGYSIFPAEIERVLAEHPDVDLAVAFGIPHPTKGERPVAAVTLRAGASATGDDLRAFAREKLADYKAPRAVFVIAPEDVPYGPTRKVLRSALADRFREG